MADLAVIVAGVALAITVPSQPMGAVLFFAPPPLIFLVLVMGLRLTMSCGLVLALVVLFRRWRYGGPVWPAEWLALLLASFLLVEAVPPLDAAVNAYYRAVGSSAARLRPGALAAFCPRRRRSPACRRGLGLPAATRAPGRMPRRRPLLSASSPACSSGSGVRARWLVLSCPGWSCPARRATRHPGVGGARSCSRSVTWLPTDSLS